ncbi:MAG: polysaccharide biosynthesis tyrosine autokinase [Nitrospirota bacterium]
MKENSREKDKALDKRQQYPVTSPQPSYYSPDEEVHLRDYLQVLIRRKWVVITFLVVVVTTVIIGTFMMSPQYKATVTIKIDKENPNILAFKDVVGVERVEEDYYQTQYKILKSRNLAKRVIRSQRLNTNPEFVPAEKKKEDKPDNNPLLKQDNPLEDDGISSDLIDSFLARMDVDPVPKSRLVNVSFISHDPELSASIANAIGDAYIGFNLESKVEATYQARIWLEKQLEDMKAKVEQSEEKLNKYAERNKIIFLKEKEGESDSENIIMKKLSELSTNLTVVTADRIGKEALYRETLSADPESSSIVINNSLIMSLKKEFALLESEYNEQLKIYKPDYPKMVKLREHIDQIKKKIDHEMEKVISSIKADYEVAVQREKRLDAEVESLKKEALNLNQRAIQYQILKREVDTTKELYNGLLQRLKEAGVSATLTASNIQILDRAEFPQKPFKPRKSLNIILSMIIGILGGIGMAFFIEYFDNTIKTPEDIEKKIYLPSLGLIPHYTDNKNIHALEYITHSDGQSPISESYRSIKTFLLLSAGGSPPRVIMVTSAERDEGKTTISTNTAIALIRSNVKVVIIDADMRRPRLHRIFGLDNDIGLSTFLSGNVELGDGMIKVSEIPNLDIIVAGHTPPNPAELLSSYRFRDLIQDLYSRYNFIVIDTPPTLGISDPLIVSQHADGVILVVRCGKTPKEAVQETRRLLDNVNAKILGVILNSVNLSDIRFGHYYNYYRYYYKSYYSNEKK